MKSKAFFTKLFDQARQYAELREEEATLDLQLALLDAEGLQPEDKERSKAIASNAMKLDELELGLEMMEEIYQDKLPYFWAELFFAPKKKQFLVDVCEKKGVDIHVAELVLLNKMRLECEADPEKYEQLFEWLDRQTWQKGDGAD